MAEKAKVKVKKVKFTFPANFYYCFPEQLSCPRTPKCIYLAGTFNNWREKELPLKKEKNGDWTISIDLQVGRYEYKFFVDGIWYNDPNAREVVPNVWGSENSVIEVK